MEPEVKKNIKNDILDIILDIEDYAERTKTNFADYKVLKKIEDDLLKVCRNL